MDGISETSAFLRELRELDYSKDCWHCWYEGTKKKIIQHQSEFPLKIRPHIHEAAIAADSNAELFCNKVYGALKLLFLCVPEKGGQWDGLDSDVDTEDQVEVAIRLFPPILNQTLPIKTNGRIVHHYPIFLMAMSIKSVRFVPLLSRLGIDLNTYFPGDEDRGETFAIHMLRGGSPLLELHTNQFLEQHDFRCGEEFDRKLDEAFLSVLVDLKQKGLTRKEDVYHCVDSIVYRKPSRTDKRLRFLLDWDPTVFLKGIGIDTECSVFRMFLCRCKNGLMSEDEELNRFQTLLELGLSNYPKQIGFLFHTNKKMIKSHFELACAVFGKGKLTEMVDKIILKSTLERCDAIQTLVFDAAANKDVLVDALYFFVRQDPDTLFRSFQ